MLPLYIVPSTTYKGALDALTEPNPRIRIEEDSPGCPVAAVTWTPEAFPSNAAVTLVIARFSMDLAPTVEAAPVKDDFFCVP